MAIEWKRTVSLPSFSADTISLPYDFSKISQLGQRKSS